MKAALAKKLQTVRSQMDRLLDPEKTGVTSESLSRAAHAVGRELLLEVKLSTDGSMVRVLTYL